MTSFIDYTFENIKEKFSLFKGGSVYIEKDEPTGIATIVFDHPEKRNAISGKMMVDFRNCMEVLEEWDKGKGVILCGKGGNFCSGGDLDFVKEIANSEDCLKMATWMQDTLTRLQKLPMISVCIVEGPTLGGGTEISIFCDYIVAADNVKYGFVHGKMGIVTAWGAGTRLTQKLGPKKALDILLTARIMSAEECKDMGIADLIVPADVGLEKTKEWLTSRLQYHHSITRAFKEIIWNSNHYPYEQALKLEKNVVSTVWGASVNMEALNKKIKHVKK